MLGDVYSIPRFRPHVTKKTILTVTAWRDSKYAATGVVIELAMDNNFVAFEVRFFDAAPKDRMVRYFLMSFQKTRNP